MEYVADEEAVRPPLSVYVQVAVWVPMPAAASGPEIGESTGFTTGLPSSTSETEQAAVLTAPKGYDAPIATPVTATIGAEFAGGATVTVNVAGSRSMVWPVVFPVWDRVMEVVPAASGLTVSVFTSPQELKVTELGLTVATLVLEELTFAL
ncbi:hypothetical protein GCM10009817_37580 [Terrabacter lapilli]|uniref:Uncharacterized protein n=2 Tax=Terrabacter lapilli TaxID=436231 RepID=A0ABN2SSR1_9MICO